MNSIIEAFEDYSSPLIYDKPWREDWYEFLEEVWSHYDFQEHIDRMFTSTSTDKLLSELISLTLPYQKLPVNIRVTSIKHNGRNLRVNLRGKQELKGVTLVGYKWIKFKRTPVTASLF